MVESNKERIGDSILFIEYNSDNIKESIILGWDKSFTVFFGFHCKKRENISMVFDSYEI